MSASYISAETVHQSSSTDSSFAITIPSDAEAVIVSVSGYILTGTYIVDKLNFDDTAPIDFTSIVTQPYTTSGATDDQAISDFIMTDTDANWPGTGAATIYYSTSGAVQEGFNVLVYYVKGLDKADPIRDTDSQEGSDAGYGSGSTWTSAMTGVVAGDLSFMAAYHYQTGLTIVPAGSGQTAITTSSDFNNNVIGVSYKDGESAMQVQGVWRVSTAFAIKQAAAPSSGIEVLRRRISEG